MRLTIFTKHAFNRLNQRTKLSCEDIASILDKGLFVNMGNKPGIQKSHLLFYSQPDDSFFVAIHDGVAGLVVTVLPLDYHKRLAWEISEEACKKAQQKLLNTPVIEKAEPSKPKLEPTIFAIYGHFLDKEGMQKSKLILKKDSRPYMNDLKVFLEDEITFSTIHEYAILKGINPEQLFSISIRLGNKGDPVYLSLSD